MRYLIFIIFTISISFADLIYLAEEILPENILGSNQVVYYCNDGMVEAHILNNNSDVLAVAWENPNDNNVTKLSCDDFIIWQSKNKG